MSTAHVDPEGPSDAELIASVRAGNLDAYGPLYERHVTAAYNLARQLTRSATEADDLVAEAFSKVLDTLRAGRGPDSAFRAYLLTALRHTAYDKTRKDKRVDLSDDMTAMTAAGGTGAEALTVPFSDTAVAGLERSLAAKAFARLPERWQAVLWHTEIEQQSPAEVAPLLGLTPNGVSALAYRAREGLRQAYLQVHLAETTAERCRATADKLGAWTRDGLAKRERAQVEAHLDECNRCRALAAELADVNGALRSIIAPLVLGTGAALGYLAASGSGKAAAASAAGAGAAAAGSGGGAAAASAPRQFVGVGASGVALAAAIALALTAGGGSDIPTAQQAPPPPGAPAPVDPADPGSPPAPQAPPGAPGGPQNPPAPQAPPPAQPAPPPAGPQPAPAPAPSDAAPRVVADAPPNVLLVPGGDPVQLPITVRNDGRDTSEPVDVTLNLPPGVSSVGPGGGGTPAGGGGSPAGGGGAAAGAPVGVFGAQQARQGGVAERVSCPGGAGTVTCSTRNGLEPGESAVLVFTLRASENAQGGQVTGTVDSGSPVEVRIAVPVVVASTEDAVHLKASPWFPWSQSINIIVRNDGDLPRTATVTVDERAHYIGSSRPATCETSENALTCTTTQELEPGEEFRMAVMAPPRFGHEMMRGSTVHPHEERDITITATLGEASASRTVTLAGWGHWFGFLGDWKGHGKARDVSVKSATATSTTSSTTTTTTTSESSEPSESPEEQRMELPAPPTKGTIDVSRPSAPTKTTTTSSDQASETDSDYRHKGDRVRPMGGWSPYER